MQLTVAQLAVLQADLAVRHPNAPQTPDGAFAVAEAYNQEAVPPWIVWRTAVPEADCTDLTSAEGTTWNWSAFIARSQGERDGWARLFSRGEIDAAKPNVRQAIADIFSGAQNNAPAQRTHIAAIGKRRATVAEQLFSTGEGSTAVPATLGAEGDLAYADVLRAWGR